MLLAYQHDSGFVNAINHIRICLIAGKKLPTLLKKTEYYLEIMNRYGNAWAKSHMLLYWDTILVLMGKGSSDSSDVQENLLKNPAHLTNYHKAMQSYWRGHSERCHHFSGKLMLGDDNGCRHHRVFFLLYYGLNSFKMLKPLCALKLKAIPQDTVKALQTAAHYSPWNFRNKVHLLQAQILSHEGRNDEAGASYGSAITSARSSGFIHEEGLASELAGFHYKKIGDHRSARGFFNQARECYTEWGSQLKVDSISLQLGLLA